MANENSFDLKFLGKIVCRLKYNGVMDVEEGEGPRGVKDSEARAIWDLVRGSGVAASHGAMEEKRVRRG